MSVVFQGLGPSVLGLRVLGPKGLRVQVFGFTAWFCTAVTGIMGRHRGGYRALHMGLMRFYAALAVRVEAKTLNPKP